ncbi:hypothetical protein GBA52_010458 [Prunus armeniaca]|nr:hypothetical protein GBA52_010458 [Prunus armeniaca]
MSGRASWAWASLLEGKDILLHGAHWQVMNEGRPTGAVTMPNCYCIFLLADLERSVQSGIGAISLSPTRTINDASISINEFLGTLDYGRHQTKPPTFSNGNQKHLWNPSASTFIKINVDAS